MKNKFSKITTLILIVFAIVSCKKTINKTEATSAEEVTKVEGKAQKFQADTENSVILWKGSKIGDARLGTLHISEGNLTLVNGKLTGGDFVIDMNTIKDTDIEDEKKNAQITGHLKSSDFFDVAQFPTATFTITNVNEEIGMDMIKGNLTIKGIEKSIEFPAATTVNGDEVLFKSEPFTIDRTAWNVKFNSGKFFDNLKYKLIKDEIELTVEIKAKKK